MNVGIIGAGAIGLATAWRLLQRGATVHVYEHGRAGHGATWASAGLLVATSAHAATASEPPLVGLCRRGLLEWPAFALELEATSGVSIDHRTEGTLLVALDERRCDRMRARATTPWLSPATIAALEPRLAGRVAGGELHADEHSIDTQRLVIALATVVRQLGGIVHEHTSASLVLGGARPIVRSQLGDRTHDDVVIASGAWSGTIHGVPDELTLPTRPVKGQMIALRNGPSAIPLRHTVMTDYVYVVPRGDRLLVGATVEDTGFDATILASSTARLLAGARCVLPEIDETDIVDAWAGLRPGTPDDAPLLGRLTHGLVAACGHYRNGILLTPLTSEIVADIVCGRTAPTWIEPFAAGRFR